MTERAPVSKEFVSWDFAGFDGLAVARLLFGEEVSHLAAYQSLETSRQGTDCSLLRLGETNFRVSIHKAAGAFAEALHAAAAGRQVWVKPTQSGVLRLDEEAWEHLLPITTVKPPHRLSGLTQNRAMPARISGYAALVWRHRVHASMMVEIQAAPEELDAIAAAISA